MIFSQKKYTRPDFFLDSPFTFNVDSVNEGKMSAYGPGLTAGVVNKPCYFTILTKTVRNPGDVHVLVTLLPW